MRRADNAALMFGMARIDSMFIVESTFPIMFASETKRFSTLVINSRVRGASPSGEPTMPNLDLPIDIPAFVSSSSAEGSFAAWDNPFVMSRSICMRVCVSSDVRRTASCISSILLFSSDFWTSSAIVTLLVAFALDESSAFCLEAERIAGRNALYVRDHSST